MRSSRLLTDGPDGLQFLRDTRALAPFLRELPPVDDDLTQARARCPDCGIPTVPDHQELTHEARLCEACYLNWSEEDHHGG